MALKFHMLDKEAGNMKMHMLKERTHVTRDGKKLMGAKDTEGVLLGGAGAQIPHEQAVELGLVEAAAAPETKEQAPAEDKGKKKK